MDDAERKLALRMIPYGVFVVSAIDPATGQAAAVTVHWASQTSFSPCLVMASLPANHQVMALVRASGRFALNLLGRDDAAEAVHFSRGPHAFTGNLSEATGMLGGYRVMWGRQATILLMQAVAVLECITRAILPAGDHHPVIGEVVEAHVRLPQDGRPDEMTLQLRELGPTVFYGG